MKKYIRLSLVISLGLGIASAQNGQCGDNRGYSSERSVSRPFAEELY